MPEIECQGSQAGPCLNIEFRRWSPNVGGDGRRVSALIDTGATHTVLSPAIVEQLGLESGGEDLLGGLDAKPEWTLQYPVHIVFPGVQPLFAVVFGRDIGPLDCLLGRDVLRQLSAILKYDYTSGVFRLKYARALASS